MAIPGKVLTAGSLTLTSIAVRRQAKGVLVVIRGDGPLRYQIVPVDSLSLVLDFPGGSSSLSFRVLPVGHVMLSQIRIGQDRRRLRLVFDLTTRAQYAIKTGLDFLAVQFKS